MTTSTAPLPVESFALGAESPLETRASAKVLYREFQVPRRLPLPNTVGLDTLLQEFEADPDMARRMAESRRRLAETMYADEPEGFSALRLAAGFSQAQLASAVGTSQSHISGIERGHTDPGTDVVARLAEVLGVSEVDAFRAIRLQRAARG
jgi:DNA-binding XRE family transcriptional regulator